MNTVSLRFTGEMDQILTFLDLLSATFILAKNDLKNLRSKHSVVQDAKTIHQKVRSLSTLVVAYDGAFLTISAQFELAIRDLIEEFIGDLKNKLPDYNHLPIQIKKWHPTGCAHILINLGQDRFKHLTENVILANLASCLNHSTKNPYQLTAEAFSDHDRNFKPEVLDEILRDRLGLNKVWQKLAREPILLTYLGSMTSSVSFTENLAREKLRNYIERRNAIIHRGRNYYTPSESEVRECAQYFKVLIQSLSIVMDKYLQSL